MRERHKSQEKLQIVHFDFAVIQIPLHVGLQLSETSARPFSGRLRLTYRLDGL